MRDAAVSNEASVAMLSISLDRDSDEPLVQQLYLRLRELILSQRLPAGARLPSTRKLSRDLEVSRTVTLDAFGQLAAEGFLNSRGGSGHFVAALPLARAEAAATAPASADDELGTTIWSAEGLPFDPAWQAVDLFPGQLWGRMLGRGWRSHQSAALQRHWAGLPALREAVATHLQALRGVPLSADQILVTSGNADALSLIARMIRRRGGSPRAWLEDPGLGTSRDVLEREGIATVAVPVDQDGLNVPEGERLAPDASVALVTPTRQFPLGMPMTLARRLSLLSWARQRGAIVLDDDYDGEIRFSGRPLQSLANLDPFAPVLTLGSFSKLTFPGLRLGYAAGPADLIGELASCRRETFVPPPTSVQAAFAEFIVTGGFARHLRQLRSQLTRRRRVLHDLLRERGAGLVEMLPQQAGMHMTVRLAEPLARRLIDIEIAEVARRRGVVLLPLSPQFVGAQKEQGFLLGYAGWDELRIEAAARRFLELLRELGSP